MRISKYKLILLYIDFSILFILYHLIYLHFFDFNIGNISNLLFILLSLIIPLIFLFNFQSNNLYKLNVVLQRAAQLAFMIKAYFYSTMVIVLFLFIIGFPYYTNPRLFLLIYILSTFLVISFYRIVLARFILGKILNKNMPKSRVAILGAGKSGKLLLTKLLVENINDFGYEILGFYDDNLPLGSNVIKDYKVLGTFDDLISSNGSINEVFVSIDNISYERLVEIIEKLNGSKTIVKVNSELLRTIPDNIFAEKLGGISIVNTTPALQNGIVMLLKKVFDKIMAFIGLVLLSPLFLVIALLIKLTSRGPVFYKQDRIGLNGRVFKFYKFRSMIVSEEGDEERVSKMIKFIKGELKKVDKVINERRVTSIGKIIRKFSIDELPQLINVLKGDMSLVGPRPCLPYEYENYESWQKKRTVVLPGCTGVWQVYGRGKVDFKDSVIMDLYYIHNMSPWLDLQLIFKTIPVLIFGRGGK